MKFRTDFVTNSSSSSFLIYIKIDLKDKSAINMGLDASRYDGPLLWLTDMRIKPGAFKRAHTTEDIISIIDKASNGETYDEEDEPIPIGTGKDEIPLSRYIEELNLESVGEADREDVREIKEFYVHLRELDFKDIKKITVIRERYYHNGGDWSHKQSYDFETKELYYEKGDEAPPDEG